MKYPTFRWEKKKEKTVQDGDENLTLHVWKIWVFQFMINKTGANHTVALTDVSKLRVGRVCIIYVHVCVRYFICRTHFLNDIQETANSGSLRVEESFWGGSSCFSFYILFCVWKVFPMIVYYFCIVNSVWIERKCRRGGRNTVRDG